MIDIDKSVTEFLRENRFIPQSENVYSNGNCTLTITEQGYEIRDMYNNTMYSKDHNIYWLIGLLTYFKFMDRNYTTSFFHNVACF